MSTETIHARSFVMHLALHALPLQEGIVDTRWKLLQGPSFAWLRNETIWLSRPIIEMEHMQPTKLSVVGFGAFVRFLARTSSSKPESEVSRYMGTSSTSGVPAQESWAEWLRTHTHTKMNSKSVCVCALRALRWVCARVCVCVVCVCGCACLWVLRALCCLMLLSVVYCVLRVLCVVL